MSPLMSFLMTFVIIIGTAALVVASIALHRIDNISVVDGTEPKIADPISDPIVPIADPIADPIIYVRAGGGDGLDGLTPVTALRTVEAAISILDDTRFLGDAVIDIGDGLFTLGNNPNWYAKTELPVRSITIRGAGTASAPIAAATRLTITSTTKSTSSDLWAHVTVAERLTPGEMIGQMLRFDNGQVSAWVLGNDETTLEIICSTSVIGVEQVGGITVAPLATRMVWSGHWEVTSESGTNIIISGIIMQPFAGGTFYHDSQATSIVLNECSVIENETTCASGNKIVWGSFNKRGALGPMQSAGVYYDRSNNSDFQLTSGRYYREDSHKFHLVACWIKGYDRDAENEPRYVVVENFPIQEFSYTYMEKVCLFNRPDCASDLLVNYCRFKGDSREIDGILSRKGSVYVFATSFIESKHALDGYMANFHVRRMSFSDVETAIHLKQGSDCRGWEFRQDAIPSEYAVHLVSGSKFVGMNDIARLTFASATPYFIGAKGRMSWSRGSDTNTLNDFSDPNTEYCFAA
jgi:hypothetical protein